MKPYPLTRCVKPAITAITLNHLRVEVVVAVDHVAYGTEVALHLVRPARVAQREVEHPHVCHAHTRDTNTTRFTLDTCFTLPFHRGQG